MTNQLFFQSKKTRQYAPQGLAPGKGLDPSVASLLLDSDDLFKAASAPIKSSTLKMSQRKYSTDSIAFYFNNRLSFAFFDWESVKEVLSKKAEDFIKGRNEQALGSAIGWGLVTEEDESHRQDRQRLNPAFHKLVQSNYSAAIEKSVHSRENTFSSKEGFELTPTIRQLMYEISLRGFLGMDKDSFDMEFEYHLGEIQTYVSESAFVEANKLREYVQAYSHSRMKVLENVEQISKRIVESAEESDNIFQQALIQMYGSDIKPGEGLYAQVGQFLAAGTETTSSLIAFLLLELIDQPDAWELLAKEVSSGETEQLASFIDETLRLHTPAPVITRVARRDVDILGVVVPAGSEVFVSPLVTHTMEKYYPEPDSFISGRKKQEDQATPFFPFGFGPRMCIGFQTARHTTISVMTHFLQQYQPVSASSTNQTANEFFIRFPARDIKVWLQPRSNPPLS